MRVLLHKDNSLTCGVEQQLDAGHARAGRHVRRVDGIDIPTLEHGVLLSVDRLTGIQALATWRVGSTASVWKSNRVEWVMVVAVRKASRDAVVPSSQHVATSVQQHTTNLTAAARRPLGGQQGQLHGPLVAAGSHLNAPTSDAHRLDWCHAEP